MKNKKASMISEWRMIGFIGTVFKLEYSLKSYEVTKYTTPLGYFHDMKLVVVAPTMEEAIKSLHLWHTDGKPEAIKVTEIGLCIKSPPTK